MDTSPTLLTAKEVAAILRISLSGVYELAHAKKLSHLRLGPQGGSIRFRRDDIEAYMQGCHRQADDRPALANARPHRRRGLRELRHFADLLPDLRIE